jgi:hypothetical protein
MYKKNIMPFLFGLLLAVSMPGLAENSQDFGEYVVHFNALNTTYLPPDTTRQYGLKRSKNRGMVNITVLSKMLGTAGKPVAASVSATATNLTGQKRDISLREIREGPAIYYIGDFPITNEETLRFAVNVKPEGQKDTFAVDFKQQFFTE